MPRFIVKGLIAYPATVIVEAETADEAGRLADAGEYSLASVNDQPSLSSFDWDGFTPEPLAD